MDSSTLSASDVALLNRNDGFGWGGDSMMWIFALLILAGGGFGGFGFGNNAALGYENLATSNEVQRGFDNQNLQAQTRDILAAVNAGTAQSVAATNATFHDNLAAMQSLYNETANDRIYPTPLVVTAGLLTDRDLIVRAGMTKEGDYIYIVGKTEGSLAASRWQSAKNGKPLGKTVEPDLEAEKSFRERALKTAREQAAVSGRVAAGGGLATALANEAIASGVGMEITLEPGASVESLLFSEGGARAVYSVAPEKAAEFERIWSGFPAVKAGRAGGKSFVWKNIFSLTLDELTEAFSGEKR